jgi:hypothetical protein
LFSNGHHIVYTDPPCDPIDGYGPLLPLQRAPHDPSWVQDELSQ